MNLARELATLETVGTRARERGPASQPPPPAILRMHRPPVEVVNAYLDELIAEAVAHPAPIPLPAPVRRAAPVAPVPPPTALQVVRRLLTVVEREIERRKSAALRAGGRMSSKQRGEVRGLQTALVAILREKRQCLPIRRLQPRELSEATVAEIPVRPS